MAPESWQTLQQLVRILKSESVRRLLVVLASVAFTISCVEFLALIGVVDYRVVFGPRFTPQPGYNVADPEFLSHYPPYLHLRGEARGGAEALAYRLPLSERSFFQWNLKYDHNGFRNKLDLKSADMVVMGDSFVEELTIPDAQLMTSLLSHLQGGVIANLRHFGYGPPQEQIVSKRYGLPLRPCTVVWMFYEGNDLEDVVEYDRKMHHRPNFWDAFVARSFTQVVYSRLSRLNHPSGARRSGVLQTSNGNRLTVYFLYPFPLKRQELGAIDETARILADAHKLCVRQGARLIFVFVPEKFRVLQPFCQFPQESECRNWPANDMPERVRKAVQSVSPDIGYLDLTPCLAEAAKRGEVPYYPDDLHWSSAGNKIAAEAISDYLSIRAQSDKPAGEEVARVRWIGMSAILCDQC